MPQRLPMFVFATLILAVFIFVSLSGLWVDWLWFQEVGYVSIFEKTLATKALLGLLFGLAFFFAIHSTFSAFRKPLELSEKQPFPMPLPLAKLGLLLALFAGYIGSMLGASQWESFLLLLNGSDFGETEPVFNRDIGYYVFHLPALQFLVLSSYILLFLSGGITMVGHFLLGSISMERTEGEDGRIVPKVNVADRARTHLSILGFLFFLVTAAKIHFIDLPELLYSTTGNFNGAGYTDVYATLPLKKVLFFLALGTAGILLLNAFRSNGRLVMVSVGFYFFISFVAVGAYPALLQKFIVLPNELVKETPFLERNIAATRKAYGLGKVVERDLPGDSTLTLKDIRNNQSTIRNVRLWEREPLLDTLGQLQEIRTYYQFNAVDNDRYILDGDFRQVLLSPRELHSESLPQKNFINERLTFTHGYGLAMSPVNEVTPEGLPVLFIKDLPPVSAIPGLKVTRPGIFFGELANDWVLVNTHAMEFDYPSGEKNILNHYEGKGGVPVDTLVRKLLFSLEMKTLKIFLSNDLHGGSRILLYRNVAQRVKKVAPFLRYDQDPYLVLNEAGEMKWILDAYTISDRYPYSQRAWDRLDGRGVGGRLNYIRNGVKAVVDAYDGTIQLYTADASDPLIQTYARIFPDTFKPLSEIPKDLKSHLRYPEDLFDYQTRLYSVYHMENVQVFYNKEDQWEIPSFGKGRNDPMKRHVIMKLPEEKKEEYILMIPFTPRGKDNLAAWMVVRNDGEHYGQLLVYRFPKQKLVFGPQQITNRINQDADISRQISLWDQRGSQVIRGSLLVIPVEKSLIYVQPIYLRAEGGQIPELKRVIVAYENQIAMEQTLEGALERLFGGRVASSRRTTTTEETQVEPSLKEEFRRAKQHFDRAQEALRQGDWTLYGEELRRLGDVLRQAK